MYYLNLLEINYKLLIRIQNKSKFHHKNIFQLDRFQFNNKQLKNRKNQLKIIKLFKILIKIKSIQIQINQNNLNKELVNLISLNNFNRT